MPTRRQFLEHTAALGLVATASVPTLDAKEYSSVPVTETCDLCGKWEFLTDATGVGVTEKWFASEPSTQPWAAVNVPHTWQIVPAPSDYRGVAWYRRRFEVPESWRNSDVRIHFEAVFHTATVWVNGELAGDHVRKGYTEFTVDITSHVRFGASNVVVRVNSAFDEHMLPRGTPAAGRMMAESFARFNSWLRQKHTSSGCG
jgi:beta-galactosidase/beta-glucuronidase